MSEVAAIVFLCIGGAFSLLAAIGIVRMPDLFTRMQAATKSATLGVACVLIGAALHFGDLGTAARALLVVVFLFVTAPVAAHTIARAAYFVGVSLWPGTLFDDLRGRYHRDTHDLQSPPSEPSRYDREPAGTRR